MKRTYKIYIENALKGLTATETRRSIVTPFDNFPDRPEFNTEEEAVKWIEEQYSLKNISTNYTYVILPVYVR